MSRDQGVGEESLRLEVIEMTSQNPESSATPSCERLQEGHTYGVTVGPGPWYCTAKGCVGFVGCVGCACLFLLIVQFLGVGVPFILRFCLTRPDVTLEDFSIRDMELLPTGNNTGNNSAQQWQVNSDINVTLSLTNLNSVARCFTTFRRMDLSLMYKGLTLSRSEILLGFSLKPGRSRNVTAALTGEHFQVPNEVGPALEAELRSDNVTLHLGIATRFLRNDRRSFWSSVACDVVATTPESHLRLGVLLNKNCKHW